MISRLLPKQKLYIMLMIRSLQNEDKTLMKLLVSLVRAKFQDWSSAYSAQTLERTSDLRLSPKRPPSKPSAPASPQGISILIGQARQQDVLPDDPLKIVNMPLVISDARQQDILPDNPPEVLTMPPVIEDAGHGIFHFSESESPPKQTAPSGGRRAAFTEVLSDSVRTNGWEKESPSVKYQEMGDEEFEKRREGNQGQRLA